MAEDYQPDDLNQYSAWDDLELGRRLHAHRVLAVRMGDIYTDIAWITLHRTGGDGPNMRLAGRAVGLLMKAAAEYQRGELTRRAAAVWRYARLIHRAKWRAV